MAENDIRDFNIADRAARLNGGTRGTAKHIRTLGAVIVGLGLVLAAINAYTIAEGTLYMKLLLLPPPTILLGAWWIADASALAEGTRKKQQVLVWVFIAIGCAIGLALFYALTRTVVP